MEPADDKGCCKGQTGHHLIYGAMVRGSDSIKNPRPPACPGYDHGLAPTVCTEGVNQNHGSHGRVHDAMDKQVRILANTGGIKDGKIDMETAIDMAATSHMAAFPLSKCSRACILAQLKAFYDDLKCDKVDAVDKRGNLVRPSGGNTTAE